MKSVYKKHTALQEYPYFDNCYVGTEKRNVSDITVTTPEAYEAFWKVGQLDYKIARKNLQEFVIAQGGFASLSPEYKEKAAIWFAVPIETIVDYYTIEKGLTLAEFSVIKTKNGAQFRYYSTQARQARFDAVFDYVRNNVLRIDLDLISQDLNTYQFQGSYVTIGNEGSMKTNYEGASDDPGFFDYVYETPLWKDILNFPTLNQRLQNPLYGLTAQEISNKCIDILDNGNY